MRERSELISWIRGEIVGPAQSVTAPTVVEFADRQFVDAIAKRRGPLAWLPVANADAQEILYFDRESPHRKYGAGLLHPAAGSVSALPADQAAAAASDSIGAEPDGEEGVEEGPDGADTERDEEEESDPSDDATGPDTSDDFEVTSPDIRRPATIAVSFCVRLEPDGLVVVRLPPSRRFFWQADTAPPILLNGRYEPCTRRWAEESGLVKEAPAWRRRPAVTDDAHVTFASSELIMGHVARKDITMPAASPLSLRVEVFPRRLSGRDGIWLLTVVLRNSTVPAGTREPREAVLYQSLFEVSVVDGCFEKYPESERPFERLDLEEQSLALLYRESAIWAIGHGCSAAWDCEPGATPELLYADAMPAVQLPSMTPDIEVNGAPIRLSMRDLAGLSDDGAGSAWESLERLADGYASWILARRREAAELPRHLAAVANRHLDECNECLVRIRTGTSLLRNDPRARKAFRLANLAMLLQQIATKQIARRPLSWDANLRLVTSQGEHRSPWSIYESGGEDATRLGSWRAFQIAFLLMSLSGAHDKLSPDREIVDLVWFPTGGGKTEAYLAVMAFYAIHERLLMETDGGGRRRDGTNVIMRYTLRMLTTQQFQRAASLICAMEFLRRYPALHGMGSIVGTRFSVGLWIGGEGSPNKIPEARRQLADFRRGDLEGNPLVLTECPWCRAEIGRFEGSRPTAVPINQWNAARTRGVTDDPVQGPLLHCPDPVCDYGREQSTTWLPVEVIDERIYQQPPSLVIATADKLAMIAYRPAAGSLFGRRIVGGNVRVEAMPPGLIIQDELHLISGPLGTMYALYEGLFERLCSIEHEGTWIKPKIVASTATIRGASDQVMALYARPRTQLFPNPGLLMGDSFFGKYARDENGVLRAGRLYLGIHASDYGSQLTTQVRAFSSALFRPWLFEPARRDAWWTLLTFYNSIRELGGAKTLFDSDIRSRLKFMFNREGFSHDDRRNIRIVEELTGRLSQAEIVGMMQRLSAPYVVPDDRDSLDACLASNIIEVGVDIDRLSLMGVVGQPKTTTTYIQVTGRVGRRWSERPGLVLAIFNPSKSRDRSHFEQFHSYHRRLYERVEPTTATPFALSAIQRGLPGALIAWARQHNAAPVQDYAAYAPTLRDGYELLRSRCIAVQPIDDKERSLAEIDRLRDELERKWKRNPKKWEDFPPKLDGEYLMLWPGQFATWLQKQNGLVVPSSMRQVDRTAELVITQGYAAEHPAD